MDRVEILLEEISMREVLEVLLPKILPAKWRLNENYFLRVHEGKSDLQKSIPNKVKVFSNFHERTGIIIVHDQDSNNCLELKQKLISLCSQNGNCPYLIRIVCRELEAWYLGDMMAVQGAYPRFKASQHRNKAKFRDPDVCNASQEIKKLLPEFQKIASARKIAQFLNIGRNRSTSFNQFISGMQKFFSESETE